MPRRLWAVAVLLLAVDLHAQQSPPQPLFKLEEVTKWGDMRRSSNLLGKQMLLARRLVEAGCGFVTVADAGWDMHSNSNSPKNLGGIKWLGPQVDQIYGTRRMLVIYVGSGFAGFYASYMAGHELSIGASAAICSSRSRIDARYSCSFAWSVLPRRPSSCRACSRTESSTLLWSAARCS